MTTTIHFGRLPKIGELFQVDTIPVSEVCLTDVLVEVKAALMSCQIFTTW